MWDFSNDKETGAGIEAGKYVAKVEEATLNTTKSGDGEYIKVKFRLEGGQIVYHNFNIKNKNDKATEIGRGQMKAFMRVAGKADPNKLKSPEELVGLSATISIKMDDKGDGYGAQPRITSFTSAPKAKEANPFV